MKKEGYGEFIKRHRLASGYKSQRNLAEKTGISNATISRIEQEIQKPEKRTLQTLAEYLTSTSYVELMVVCGYWGEDELLESSTLTNGVDEKNLIKTMGTGTGKTSYTQTLGRAARYKAKETPASNEEEFLNDMNLSCEELIKAYALTIDGQALTPEEAKGIIAYIRSLRQMKS